MWAINLSAMAELAAQHDITNTSCEWSRRIDSWLQWMAWCSGLAECRSKAQNCSWGNFGVHDDSCLAQPLDIEEESTSRDGEW